MKTILLMLLYATMSFGQPLITMESDTTELVTIPFSKDNLIGDIDNISYVYPGYSSCTLIKEKDNFFITLNIGDQIINALVEKDKTTKDDKGNINIIGYYLNYDSTLSDDILALEVNLLEQSVIVRAFEFEIRKRFIIFYDYNNVNIFKKFETYFKEPFKNQTK